MDVMVKFSSLEWQSPASGVRFKRMEAGGKVLRLVEFSDGFTEPDWCYRGHWGIVLSGELRVDVSGTEVVFGEGDGIAFPKGEATRHRHIGATSPTLLFLVEDD
jgi:quercetin dioxygenase-like cupin family protein